MAKTRGVWGWTVEETGDRTLAISTGGNTTITMPATGIVRITA